MEFTAEAADKLLNDLSLVRVSQLDGTVEDKSGPYVEPMHLQVVCRELWDKLPAGTESVTDADITQSGDVNQALAGYYARKVANIASSVGVSERALRVWLGGALITEQGLRGQFPRNAGSLAQHGVNDTTAAQLVNAFLLRSEPRGGGYWLELAHDRLVGPIQTNNAEWLADNLNAFQQQAALWERENRPDGLLLTGEALAEAEAWAATRAAELDETERNFLKECLDARADAEKEQKRLLEQVALESERRQMRRVRRLSYVALVIGVVSVLLFVWALSERSKALNETAKAQAAAGFNRRLLYDSDMYQVQTAWENKNYVRAIELLDNHIPKAGEDDLRGFEWGYWKQQSHWLGTLKGHTASVSSVSFSPDGARLASGSEDNTVKVWTAAGISSDLSVPQQ